MERILLNEKGSSLITLLSIVASTSVVLMMLASTANSQSERFSRNQKIAQAKDKLNITQWLLGSEVNCTPNITPSNIPNVTFDTSSLATESVKITKLQSFPSGYSLLEEGESFGNNVEIVELNIEDIVSNGGDSYSALLVAQIDLGPGMSGVRFIFRDFPINITATSAGTTATMTACSTNIEKGTGNIPSNVVHFTADTNFIVPNGVSQIHVEVWGAGGGGGGSATFVAENDACGGSGGGAGSYEKSVLNVSPGMSISIAIGTGGTGGIAGDGASTDGGNGANGTDTTFGSLVKALGGQGGGGCTMTAGVGEPGAIGTGGTYSALTPTPAPGNIFSYAGASGSLGAYNYYDTTQALGGVGGSSQGGSSGAQSGTAHFGAGGTGGYKYNDATSSRPGGTGGNGLIIVKY